MNIVKEQRIDDELQKLGGPLADWPVARWFAYNKVPYNIFGVSGLLTMVSLLFVSTVKRPLPYQMQSSMKNKIENSAEDTKATHRRNVGIGFSVLFLANFIFWGRAIAGASKYANYERDAVALMLKLKEEFPNVNLDENGVRNALKHVPYIISKMSESERVYFDMLDEGKINIADDEVFSDFAIHVLIGYLTSHPEDMACLGRIFARINSVKNQNDMQR